MKSRSIGTLASLMYIATVNAIHNILKPSKNTFKMGGAQMRRSRGVSQSPASQRGYDRLQKKQVASHTRRYPARKFAVEMNQRHKDYWECRGYDTNPDI